MKQNKKIHIWWYILLVGKYGYRFGTVRWNFFRGEHSCTTAYSPAWLHHTVVTGSQCSIGFVLWSVRSWFKTFKAWSGRPGDGGLWHNTTLVNCHHQTHTFPTQNINSSQAKTLATLNTDLLQNLRQITDLKAENDTLVAFVCLAKISQIIFQWNPTPKQPNVKTRYLFKQKISQLWPFSIPAFLGSAYIEKDTFYCISLVGDGHDFNVSLNAPPPPNFFFFFTLDEIEIWVKTANSIKTYNFAVPQRAPVISLAIILPKKKLQKIAEMKWHGSFYIMRTIINERHVTWIVKCRTFKGNLLHDVIIFHKFLWNRILEPISWLTYFPEYMD